MLGITRVPVDAPVKDGDVRLIITEGGKKAIKHGAIGGLIFGVTIASLAVKRALTGRVEVLHQDEEVSP